MTTTKDEAIKILRDALSEISDVAERCDGWQSFPSAPIKKADEALAATSHIAPDAAIQAEPYGYHYEWASCITTDGPQNFKWEFSKEHPPEWAVEDGQCRSLTKLYVSPAIAPEASELPPLPNPAWGVPTKYTAIQMHDYARDAIAMRQAAAAKPVDANWISSVIRDVAELPDRDSPEDQPEMMLVSAEELRDIIESNQAAAEPANPDADCAECGGAFRHKDGCSAWGAAAEPVPTSDYEKMRRNLVVQIDTLLDIAERHAWTKDGEEKARTEGAIKHVRETVAPYRYNGNKHPAATKPAASEAPSCKVCDDEGMVWVDGCTTPCLACQDVTDDSAAPAASEAVGVPSAANEGVAAKALRNLCNQLDGERRRMRHTPGTGQNHSYMPCEDVDAYVEEARKALTNQVVRCEECVGTGKCGPDEDPSEMDCEVCNGSGQAAAPAAPTDAGVRDKLGRIERVAACGTVDSFMALPDTDKRYWFAMAVDESDRRKLAEERLAFLHSTNKDAEGFEYGVARVRWDAAGKVEFYWALSDHSDVDAAMAKSSPQAPKTEGSGLEPS